MEETMTETTDLIQLHKDFFLLTTKVERTLLEAVIRDFLVDCEGYSLREAKEQFPLSYRSLIKDTEEYAEELDWYIANHKIPAIYQASALQKLVKYRKRSLSGLTILKRDMLSTKDAARKQHLTDILTRLVLLFNKLFLTTREYLEGTSVSQQTDWVNFYELSDIQIEDICLL
jgi:hypothetical protein